MNYGYRYMDFNRVEAMVFIGNIRSVNVLKKLGFICEGVLREHSYYKGKFWDEQCFSLLKRDWEASNYKD